MTVIVFRDGVMAADSVVSVGSTKLWPCRKVVKAPDGSLHGASGYTPACDAYLMAAEAGETLPDPQPVGDQDSNFVALVARPNGELRYRDRFGSMICDAFPYAAIGSARAVAHGALHAGATAEQAVAACIAHDTEIGGPIQAVRL